MRQSVVVIVQARMTSTRLPGKILKPIMGKPMLQIQLERLSRAQTISKIVLATTVNRDDDRVAGLAEALGVEYYRGSEPDVLDRYYQAAVQANADVVMRVTGDCPAIDPAICDKVVDKFFAHGVDFMRTGETFADGLDCEVFTFKSLEVAWKEAKLAYEREHVTEYITQHPERFAFEVLESDLDSGKYRLTVDEPEDFELISRVAAFFGDEFVNVGTQEIIAYLKQQPDIVALNSHFIRDEAYLEQKEKADNA